ncbi:MAG: ferritin-like domain-containing protein [Pseudomonadota bacterium]
MSTPKLSVVSLRSACVAALNEADTTEKRRLTRQAFKLWKSRALSLTAPTDDAPPARPGRPVKPELVHPSKVKKRGLGTMAGRVSLLHALAHIELNAIDLALDIVARFATQNVPRSFFDSWMSVADDEARHFGLLEARLAELGATYGDMPAHDGLWEAATATENDLFARLAIVPMVLEARGLDVTPSIVEKLHEFGDAKSAAILQVIYEDEKTHVAVGAKWFRFFCARNGLRPDETFHDLVRRNFRGQLKPPFNDRARAASGLTPGFYRSLSASSRL